MDNLEKHAASSNNADQMNGEMVELQVVLRDAMLIFSFLSFPFVFLNLHKFRLFNSQGIQKNKRKGKKRKDQHRVPQYHLHWWTTWRSMLQAESAQVQTLQQSRVTKFSGNGWYSPDSSLFLKGGLSQKERKEKKRSTSRPSIPPALMDNLEKHAASSNNADSLRKKLGRQLEPLTKGKMTKSILRRTAFSSSGV
jgi:hypothetical protein